jgi:hypothetical protein
MKRYVRLVPVAALSIPVLDGAFASTGMGPSAVSIESPHGVGTQPPSAPADGESGGSLLPSRLSLGLGLGMMPRVLFGQELYFHQLWSAALVGHWRCGFLPACEAQLHFVHQQFLPLPEGSSAVAIKRAERRTGIEVGFENQSWIPLGMSLGAFQIVRDYQMSLSTIAVNQSSDLDWQDQSLSPAIRAWTGIPKMAELVDLRFSLLHIMGQPTTMAHNIYSLELRFIY